MSSPIKNRWIVLPKMGTNVISRENSENVSKEKPIVFIKRMLLFLDAIT